MYAALKAPKNTVASIIINGCHARLSNLGRRALVRKVTKNPMVTLTEL